MTVHAHAMTEAVGEKLEAGTIAAVDDNLARGGIDAFERHTRTCRVERRGLGPMHDVEHPLHLVGCLAEDECARDVRLITFDRTSIVDHDDRPFTDGLRLDRTMRQGGVFADLYTCETREPEPRIGRIDQA